MPASTAGPYSLEDFRTRSPGKIEVQNEEGRTRLVACLDPVENVQRLFAIPYHQNLARHLMLFQRLTHEFYVSGVVLSQENLWKRLVRRRPRLILPLEA